MVGFDLEARVWTIPAKRYKNGLPHTVYLTDAMLEVLEAVVRFKDVDLFFPAVGNANNPLSGDQKVEDRIDKLVRKDMVEAGAAEPGNWCVHDFRRTIATGLRRLGFRPATRSVRFTLPEAVAHRIGNARSLPAVRHGA